MVAAAEAAAMDETTLALLVPLLKGCRETCTTSFPVIVVVDRAVAAKAALELLACSAARSSA